VSNIYKESIMNMTHSRTGLLVLAITASLWLSACGSGNNDGSAGVALVPGTDVPVSATQNAAAAIDFVAQVVAKGEANTEEPLVLGDAVLAVTDTEEPVSIIAA
jgi:uncharacterized membrane protein